MADFHLNNNKINLFTFKHKRERERDRSRDIILKSPKTQVIIDPRWTLKISNKHEKSFNYYLET